MKENVLLDNNENHNVVCATKASAIGEKWEKQMNDERFDAISNNLSYEDILKIGGEKLMQMSISEIILSEEQYTALGDVWKEVEHTISNSTTRTIKTYLTAEFITEIGAKNIIDKKMSVYKIKNIGNNMTIEEVRKITGKVLVEMTDAKLILLEEQYNTLIKMGVNVSDIQSNFLDMIVINLTVENLKEIGKEKIILMTRREIIHYNDVVIVESTSKNISNEVKSIVGNSH